MIITKENKQMIKPRKLEDFDEYLIMVWRRKQLSGLTFGRYC